MFVLTCLAQRDFNRDRPASLTDTRTHTRTSRCPNVTEKDEEEEAEEETAEALALTLLAANQRIEEELALTEKKIAELIAAQKVASPEERAKIMAEAEVKITTLREEAQKKKQQLAEETTSKLEARIEKETAAKVKAAATEEERAAIKAAAKEKIEALKKELHQDEDDLQEEEQEEAADEAADFEEQVKAEALAEASLEAEKNELKDDEADVASPDELKKMHAAAKVLQREKVTEVVLTEEEVRIAAAKMIQRHYRGHQARKVVKRKRHGHKLEMEAIENDTFAVPATEEGLMPTGWNACREAAMEGKWCMHQEKGSVATAKALRQYLDQKYAGAVRPARIEWLVNWISRADWFITIKFDAGGTGGEGRTKVDLDIDVDGVDLGLSQFEELVTADLGSADPVRRRGMRDLVNGHRGELAGNWVRWEGGKLVHISRGFVLGWISTDELVLSKDLKTLRVKMQVDGDGQGKTDNMAKAEWVYTRRGKPPKHLAQLHADIWGPVSCVVCGGGGGGGVCGGRETVQQTTRGKGSCAWAGGGLRWWAVGCSRWRASQVDRSWHALCGAGACAAGPVGRSGWRRGRRRSLGDALWRPRRPRMV